MKLAGEAGSLLKIEEEIREIVEEAKAEYQRELQRRRGEQSYLPGMAPPREPTLFDDLTDDEFWTRAETDIADALEAYARQAENGQSFQRRLFADDTAEGFAFVDVCRKRFDVVLMNPPFGEHSAQTLNYVEREYGESSIDIYTSFIRRSCDLRLKDGMTGIISPRSYLYQIDFLPFRQFLINDRLCLSECVELGLGVIDDATVRTVASIIHWIRYELPLKTFYLDLSRSNSHEIDLSKIVSDKIEVKTDHDGN